jgi:hypothetical protein
MDGFSAANCNQYADSISAWRTETLGDEEELWSSDDMPDELRLRSEVLHLPTELQSLILAFQVKLFTGRVKLRRGSARPSSGERVVRVRSARPSSGERTGARNRRSRQQQNNLRTQRYQASYGQ